MDFTSPLFLVGFLPVTLLVFYGLLPSQPRLATIFLVLASLLFIDLQSPLSAALILGSAILNYSLALWMMRTPGIGGIIVVLGCLINLAILGYFKLNPSAPDQLGNTALMVAGMPLGLSFYSFKQITFLIDRHTGRAPLVPVKDYMLYTTMFAHLPAGPITPYKDVVPQLRRLPTLRLDFVRILTGLSLFTVGAFKFNFISQPIGGLVNEIYDGINPVSDLCMLESWTASIGFLMQLYYDFSGYSDMAIGLAYCFGLRLSPNFDSPLRARSLSGFMNSWHMSMVVFARDYFFRFLSNALTPLIPFHTSVRRRLTAWSISLLITLCLIALWHTVSVVMIAAALIGGLLVILDNFLRMRRTARKVRGFRVPQAVRNTGAVFLVWLVAASALIFLRAPSPADAFAVIAAQYHVGDLISFATGSAQGEVCPTLSVFDLPVLSILVLAIAGALVLPNSMRLFGFIGTAEDPKRFRLRPLWGGVIAALMFLTVLSLRYHEQARFIYGNF